MLFRSSLKLSAQVHDARVLRGGRVRFVKSRVGVGVGGAEVLRQRVLLGAVVGEGEAARLHALLVEVHDVRRRVTRERVVVPAFGQEAQGHDAEGLVGGDELAVLDDRDGLTALFGAVGVEHL